MAQIILLGTGATLSDAARENMYLAVQGESSSILIDCAGSPIQRLLKAKIEFDRIDHLILTHAHPDHLYGVPIFLMDLWLAGRKKRLQIHGLPQTLDAARGLLDAFNWRAWQGIGFYPVEFHPLTLLDNEIALILDTNEFSISAAKTAHVIPSIALRIVSKKSARAAVYSSDTEKCDAVVELAFGAHLLLHEATSVERAGIGHSSARQAGSQAQHAQVKTLVLVHLPPQTEAKKLAAAAKKSFKGKVLVGTDFMKLNF